MEEYVSNNEKEEVTLSLTLSRAEWGEVANAVDSKATQVEKGDYEEEDYERETQKWLKVLESTYDKLADALSKAEVDY